MSSTKAEYIAAAECCPQVLWIKSQLADYNVLYDKVPIFCNNTSFIAISNNPVFHSRTKHNDIRYHFIRDHILKGDIELHFVPTDLQLADIFTKPLASPSFTRLVAELGMLNIKKEVLEVDIGNIIFSDLVTELQDGKEGREPNKPLASEVALTSHMLKVPKLSNEPKQSLILPSEEVNADDTIDKSLSGTNVQPYAEEPVTTANATQSLDAFRSVEELRNQSKPVDAKEIENIVEEEHDEATDSRFKSLGNVTFEELNVNTKDNPFDTKSKIKVVKRMQPQNFDDEDQIKFLRPITMVESSRDAEVNESDEIAVDIVLKVLADLANFKNASADKPSLSDPLCHLQAEVSFLTTKVEQLESSLAKKVADKLEESVPDNIKYLILFGGKIPPILPVVGIKRLLDDLRVIAVKSKVSTAGED
ncbi:hypothetical protein Tco_0983791 [Tanacetum coccineum]